ncbi:MAG: hypothetical protein AAF599_20380, partial [Bacteroidota bacterium]
LLKTLLAAFAICLFASSLSAQNYRSAVGARLGYPLSASFKTFISDENALELYVGYRGFSSYNWFSVNGAYQKHSPLDDVVEGLQWYYGFGAGVYFWTYDFSQDFSSTSLSVQGYIGVDYKFENTPLSITVDWVPTFFIGNIFTSGFGARYGSLGVRYIFKE